MRLTKLAGAAAAAGLAAAGALHAIWIVSPWPLANRADFARIVVGVAEADLPSAGATAAVAAALGTAACLIAAQARLVPLAAWPRLIRLGAWSVAGVMLARGAAGLAGLTSRSTDYTRWDLALYSPLCLGLGALAAYVAGSGSKDAEPAR